MKILKKFLNLFYKDLSVDDYVYVKSYDAYGTIDEIRKIPFKDGELTIYWVRVNLSLSDDKSMLLDFNRNELKRCDR